MPKKLDTVFCTRQYMLSDDFEVYYYHDTRLSRVDPHAHDHYEFYFFLEGDITMYIRDIPYKLSAGSMIFIPEGCPHYMKRNNPDTPYRRFVLWISKNYCQKLEQESLSYTYFIREATEKDAFYYEFDTIAFNAIQHKLFRLIEESLSNRFGKQQKLQLYIQELLLQLSRRSYEENHKISSDEGQPVLDAVIQVIEENLDRELSLDFLADKLFLNKYYISHVFKDQLGLPIHQYIIKRRLAICRDAYLCDASVTEISQKYGFGDYSNFYRAFKKEYGMSPKEYKDKYKATPLQAETSFS